MDEKKPSTLLVSLSNVFYIMFLMFIFITAKNVFSRIVFSLLLIKSNEILIPRLIFVLPFSLKLLLIKLNSGSLTCDKLLKIINSTYFASIVQNYFKISISIKISDTSHFIILSFNSSSSFWTWNKLFFYFIFLMNEYVIGTLLVFSNFLNAFNLIVG